MKLKNNSARGHWLGNVLIAPLETKEVGEEWRNAYNKQDLEEVVTRADEVVIEEAEVVVKRGRKPKVEAVAETVSEVAAESEETE
jgi:hypothetical protein